MMNSDMINQQTENAKKICQNPKLLITYLWILTLVFGAMFSLGAIVVAVNNNGVCVSDSKSLGFAAVWMMFLTIILSVGGTMVMRKFHTPLAVGFFLGVCVMMSFNMFSLSVLFCGAAYSARRDVDCSGNIHSDEAASVFSFFMFILYGVFSCILAKHRQTIIQSTTGINGEVNKAGANPSTSSLPTTNNVAPPPVSV